MLYITAVCKFYPFAGDIYLNFLHDSERPMMETWVTLHMRKTTVCPPTSLLFSPDCCFHLLIPPSQVLTTDLLLDPSLEDITIEGVTFVRSLVSDLALDVLLYQSAYRQLISEIVLKEANRIYRLFKARNPGFNGKVHVIGHSLGSAIMFDILCREKEKQEAAQSRMNPLRFWPSHSASREPQEHKELSFDFDVEDLYCLGSPVGLFQMLKGR